MEELDGSFAIAATSDDHPGELLLAKGEGSPLVVLVRDNLIMWASTTAALKYAWTTCIGTAPAFKHMKYLLSGEYMKVTVDGRVEEGKFKPKFRPYYPTQSSNKPYVYWVNGQKVSYDPMTNVETVDESVHAWQKGKRATRVPARCITGSEAPTRTLPGN